MARKNISTEAQAREGARKRGFLRRQWDRVESTDAAGVRTAYYLIIICTVILTCIGMVMVLSSSAVEYVSKDRDPFSLFSKQAGFGLAGLVAMFAIAALPMRFLKRLAWPVFFGAVALLGLVLVIGKEVLGNKNWIELGPFSLQPSEFAKFAIILWGATVLAHKNRLLRDWRHALIPVLFPGGLAVVGLVLLGHDLGTAMVLLFVLFVLLWTSGAPKVIFVVTVVMSLVGVVAMTILSPNRMGRITSWLGLNGDDSSGLGLQALQGRYALASGGWFGVGLGQSRSKWSYIPEAQNDFILSIIGEELGLVGTLAIVVLFVVLAVSMYRIAHRSRNLFVRIATSGVIAWLVGQAFINMGMVTGLLPVIGVPLPFISYGGSALLAALCGVGLVLNFARDQIRHGLPASEEDAAVATKERKA